MAGLWLSHLRLSHFRSHKHLSLDLDQRPVAVFGPNGVGKTNILEAISFLSPGRGLRRAVVADVARRPESLGWKVSGNLHQGDTVHHVETGTEGTNGRNVTLNEKQIPQNGLGKICQVVWLVPNMDRLWVEGAEGRRRFLDRLCLSFCPGHADVSLSYEKAMRERNRLLKDQVADPSWYRAIERQMAESGSEIQTNRLTTISRLQEAIAQGGSAFPECDLSLLDVDAAQEVAFDAAHFAARLNENRYRDMAAGRSLIGPHRSDMAGAYAAKSLVAKDCSTGEQKALLLSVILAHARALRADLGFAPLLLLDEVAAHLDADRCRALFQELQDLGAQAWMTGTGSEVFEPFGDDIQRLRVIDNAGTSLTELV